MSDVPKEVRVLMWAWIVSQLRVLNWLVEQKEESGTEASAKLIAVRNYLKRQAEFGPDHPGLVEVCKDAMGIAEEILSGKPYLEVIDGGG